MQLQHLNKYILSRVFRRRLYNLRFSINRHILLSIASVSFGFPTDRIDSLIDYTKQLDVEFAIWIYQKSSGRALAPHQCGKVVSCLFLSIKTVDCGRDLTYSEIPLINDKKQLDRKSAIWMHQKSSDRASGSHQCDNTVTCLLSFIKCVRLRPRPDTIRKSSEQ